MRTLGEETAMSRLISGMFDAGSDLFELNSQRGLHNGLMARNSGWFNQNGERLGQGDLGAHDLNRILMSLREDEIFIVVCEAGNAAYQQPDQQIVLQYCTHILLPKLHYCFEVTRLVRGQSVYTFDGLAIQPVSPMQARQIIKDGKAPRAILPD